MRPGCPSMPDILAHSQAPRTIMAPVNRANPKGGRKKIPPIAMGARIRAVIIRVLSTVMIALSLLFCGAGGNLIVSLTKTALAMTVGVQCFQHFFYLEIRPEHVGKIKLGVSQVPQQEVTDALLARRANQQIRHREITNTEVLLNEVIGNIRRRQLTVTNIFSHGLSG